MAAASVQSMVPSHSRVEPGSFNVDVHQFPSKGESQSADADKVAASLVDSFNKALGNKDLQALANLFSKDGYWRDHLGVSWNFHTFKGPQGVLGFLKDCDNSKSGLRLRSISVDGSTKSRAPQVGPLDGIGDITGVQFFVSFDTTVGSGEGLARLVEEDEGWKIFSLYTALRQLKGHEEAIGPRRQLGAEHGGNPDRKNWFERRVAAVNFEEKEPAVLIVGTLPSR